MVEKTLSAADLPRLVVQLPDGKEIHHSVVGTEITIGRDPSNRIPIADQFVSKFHAKLLITPTSMTLVDLGSANKTYVNGTPIRESAVRYGDELQFAGVRCRLLAPEAEERPPARPSAPPAPAKAPPRSAPKPAAAPATPPPVPPVKSRAGGPATPAGRSAPPKIEANPMKRLLTIGGLLIAVSLALGILLRVLLVPSGDAPAEPEKKTAEQKSSETTAPAVTSTAPSTPTTAPVNVSAPATAEEHFEQALSFLDTGRLKEARAAFQKALEIDPDNPRAKTRLSLLEEEIAQKADRHFGNARQAFQYLRYEEAIGEWEIFLTLAEPSDVRYAEAQQGIQQAKAKLR
jgi:hypothetical protein